MKIFTAVINCSFLLASVAWASSLQEQNKALAKRAFEELLSRGQFELAEQLYSKDFANHGIHRDIGLQEDQEALKGWHHAFPDIAIVPKKLIAEGDLVVVYWVAPRHQYRHR
jgi:predicted SnoaL-like aldol condensation-catalyzing enzyme